MRYLPVLFLALLVASISIYSCKKSSSSTTNTTPATPTSTWTCNSHLLYTDSTMVLTLPTAFTPNGDGINDFYRPIGTGITATNYLLTIYKPSGTIIFQSNSPTKSWNGLDSAGAPGTDYKYGVKISFTNAHGKTIDTCTEVFKLTTNTTSGCVNRVAADEASYIFSDQIDPTSGQAPYTTFETFCN